MSTDSWGDPLPAGAVARIGTTRFRIACRCDCLAVSPDAATLIVGGEDFFGIMDATSGKRKAKLGTHGGQTLFLDDDVFVSEAGGIRIGSVKKGTFFKNLELLAKGSGNVYPQIAVSPGKKWLACSSADQKGRMTVFLWDTTMFRLQRTVELRGNYAFYSPIAFTPDEMALAVGGNLDGSISFLDVATGKLEQSRKTGGNAVLGLAFSPVKAAMVTHDNGGWVRISTYPEQMEIKSFRVNSASSSGICFSPDGNKLLVPENRGTEFTVRDLSGMVELSIRSFPAIFVPKAQGNSLLYYESGAVRLMDIGQKKEVVRYSPMREMSAIWLTAKDQVWFPQSGATLLNWKTGEEQSRIPLSNGFCLNSDRTLMAIGKGKTIDLIELQTGNTLSTLNASEVYPQHLSSDGTFLAGNSWRPHSSGGSVVMAYNLTDKNELCRFAGIFGVCSPDGSLFAYMTDPFAGESQLVLFNTKTNITIREPYVGNGMIFSPDGKTLVLAGDDGIIQIRDAASLNKKYEFRAHGLIEKRSPVACVAFSPNGDRLASAAVAEECQIRIWDYQKRTLIKEFSATERTNRDLSFSPDGRWLASCGDSATILIWKLP